MTDATRCNIAKEQRAAMAWQSYLAGASPNLVGVNTPAIDAHDGATSESLAMTASTAKTDQAAYRMGVTATAVIQISWAATIRKFTRQNDVTFGRVVGSQESVDPATRAITPTWTMTPCRAQFDDVRPLPTLLKDFHAAAARVGAFPYVPQDLDLLFDTVLECQTSQTSAAPQDHLPHNIALKVAVYPKGTTWSASAIFHPSKLSRCQVRHLLEEFDFTLALVCDSLLGTPHATPSDLWTLSPAQMTAIQAASCGPNVPLPFELLHHAFEERARTSPDLRAVEFQDQFLSYGQLDARANAVACHLAQLGVTVGSRVAVIMERCLEFPIGLLATHKVGASTVPMDATFPSARLAFMLSDSNAQVILTTRQHIETVNSLDSALAVLCIDSARLASTPQPLTVGPSATRDDEAYVVYTSGSTGKPKGVPVKHAGIVNSVTCRASDLGIVQGARVMQFMAIGFDVCQWEIWSALSHGATLVLRSGDGLAVLSTVNVLAITPTGLAALGCPCDFPNLRTVCVGGEAISTSLRDRWCEHVALFNSYGPTEGSCTTHMHQLAPGEPISIGRPIPNVSCYVLDEGRRRVPVGAVGELYLGGLCVAFGYINLPDMTSSRFLDDPFSVEGGRMYRTGDLVSMLPSGQIHFIGRVDTQVKLKGYRVELDEVANAMMQHPSVVSAAVVKDKTHLVGYFTPADVDVDSLRRTVADQLPVYMVPALWVGLDAMPLNSNGKIDKNCLGTMDIYVAVDPLETETEVAMAGIWADVLGVKASAIGRKSSYFALGGDSLSAVRVVAACKESGLALTTGQLMQEMVLWRVATAVSRHIDVSWPSAEVSGALKAAIGSEWPSIAQWNQCVVYLVTPLQGGMLFATLTNPQAYVLQTAVLLADATDAAKFANAFKAVVNHHAVLRTTFVTTSTGMYQVVRPAGIYELAVSKVAAPDLADFWAADQTRGFQVGDESFVRLSIVETVAGLFAALTFHHAVIDGWSMAMLWDDLSAAMTGNQVVDRPSFHQVVDFIEAQDSRATEAFWQSYLSGVVASSIGTSAPPLTSQTDSTDDPLCMQAFASLSMLTARAQSLNVTVAELVKFAWAATVRKYTRQNDVVFGHVMANRDIPVHQADRIIGPLVTTVPCRVQFNDTLPLTEMLDSLRRERGVIATHSHASLADLKRWSGVEGDLFDTLLVFQNLPTSQLKFGHVVHPTKVFATDLTLEVIVTPTATALSLEALYHPAAIAKEQAQRMLREFDYTLTQMCDSFHPEALVSDLWHMSPAQTAQIQAASCGPAAPLPFELLHHAFEERARTCPDLRAVEFQDQWLSYGQLNARANAVACHLAQLGVTVGSRVAVIMERCLEFPIGLLATHKAGASTVPMDATFPSARLSFMLSDSNAQVILTTRQHVETVNSLDTSLAVLCIDLANLQLTPPPLAFDHAATRHDEAYVVYTSGSTGKPKGVPVKHAGIVNSVTCRAADLGIVQGARVMQFMAIGFDVCQWEIWSALSHGATLVLRSGDGLDVLSTVNVLAITPTGLAALGCPCDFSKLTTVCVGGEAIPTALRDRWCEHVALFNSYGPTEGSCTTHMHQLGPGEPISIGRPIPNVSCYVLDEGQRRVPIGAVGELYLGGLCVAFGYINLPDMTSSRFLDDPFSAERGRMYRTGDLVSMLPNGQIHFIGRVDTQVKLKGYRVELDEVANAMMQHPSVVSAAAVVKDKTHLVGYFTPADVDVDSLRRTVADQLPVYMVPALWVGLDAMPLNSNGKIDKNSLGAMDLEVAVEVLETDTEVLLARVWAQVFGVNAIEIGRGTSMFSLGGDSILAIRLAAACKKVGLELSVGDIIKYNRLGDMALRVGQVDEISCDQAQLDPTVLVQVAKAWPAFETAYGTTPEQAYQVRTTKADPSMWVLQLPLSGLDAGHASAAFVKLAVSCETLRTTFVDTDLGVFHVVNSAATTTVHHAQTRSLDEFLAADATVGFTLFDPSFARFTVVATDDAEVAVLTIHHALYDGWSISLLLSDLLETYRTRTAPPPRPSFRAVVDYLHTQDTTKTVAFWTEYLAGAPPSEPSYSILRRQPSFDKTSVHATVPSLQTLAQRIGVTVSTVVLLGWAMTLQLHTGRDDVVFGQVQANRDLPVEGMDRMLGCAMSSVPCRVQFNVSMTLAERLQALQSGRIEKFGHCMIDPEDKATWSHLPAMQYDTEVAFHNFGHNRGDVDELLQLDKGSEQRFVAYKVELNVMPTSSGVQIDAAFDPDRIEAATVSSMVDTLHGMLIKCQEVLGKE